MHSQASKSGMTGSSPIITLHDISMRWDSRTVLKDINLDIHQDDFMVITGPNGGGKSTLLRIILKLLKPTTGSVSYYNGDGRETDSLHIGYLPQKSHIDSHFPITVREVIQSGLMGCRSIDKKEHQALVNKTLETTGLVAHAGSPIGSLSGGQLQRTLLGRAIISSPHVLVLDEPMSYLDRTFEHETYELLRQLASTTTILLVTHDYDSVQPLATRHITVDVTVRQ